MREYHELPSLVRSSVRVIGTALDIRRRARRRLARGGILLSLGVLLLLTWLVLHYLDIGSLSVYFLVGFSGILAAAWGIGSLRRALTMTATPAAARAVIHALADALDDDYVLLRQVSLPPSGAFADVVLLGPHGVLVLSLQALEGTYLQREHRWYRLATDGAPQPWDRSPTWDLTRPWKSTRRLVREYAVSGFPVGAAVVLVSGSLAADETDATTAPEGELPENGAAGPPATADRLTVAAARVLALGQAEPAMLRSRFLRRSTEEDHPVFPVITGAEVVGLVKALPAAERATPELIAELVAALRPYVG